MDALVEQLVTCAASRESQAKIIEPLVTSDVAMFDAALKAYFRHFSASNIEPDPLFLTQFTEAWVDFTINALANVAKIRPATQVEDFSLPGGRILYATWHFPEYPLILDELVRKNIIAVVAQNSFWMRKLEINRLTLNFNTAANIFRLRRVLEAGQPLLMMFDYCYSGTRNRSVQFMGEPTATPSGLIEWARRHGYEVRFITIQGSQFHSEAILCANSPALETMAALNVRIESDILAAPSKWLLWGSLEARRAKPCSSA